MRSLWKIKYTKSFFYKNKKKISPLYKRDSIVISPWIGKNISIYTGNTFRKILVERKHLGYKIGEFAFSRKYTKKAVKSNVKKTVKKS